MEYIEVEELTLTLHVQDYAGFATVAEIADPPIPVEKVSELGPLHYEQQASSGVVVKSGSEHSYLEALNLALITQLTTIPVPRILQITTVNSTVYLVMERIEGMILEARWPHLSFFDKLRVAWTLRSYVAQLRRLRRSVPGHLDGTMCARPYFAFVGFTTFSSYTDLLDFWNHKLFVSKRAKQAPQDAKGFDDSMPLVFMHQDLCMRNILLGNDGKVYILDWEYGGFYLEWLEYACMRRSQPWPWLWRWLLPFIAGSPGFSHGVCT